ncbi:ribosome modulation factor [Nitratireductor rhodophyticola]|uniref:ribosome modulation factor n=1 Tax=Nitratireductor rhodophyticola TaxID=2854036 RepID=UPI003BAA52B8
MTKAKAAKAEAGHNVQDEREQFIQQQFLNGLVQIKGIKSNIATEMADAKDVYGRLKPYGYTPADFKWAMELEDKDSAAILAMWERRLKIARWLGHGLARQFDMFDEDRTPIEERAYEEGLAAGKLRKGQGANPYDATSAAGQAWLKGEAEGNAFANKDLSHVMDEADPEFPDEEPEAAEA